MYNCYLPIKRKLLNRIIDSVESFFADNPQPYLVCLYKALISTTFGLFRIGEVTHNNHVVKAKDVQIGTNKNKLLFVLYSSKTHDKSSKPQTVTIDEIVDKTNDRQEVEHHNCPFQLLRDYLAIRRPYYKNDAEQFFVFSNGSPVYPSQFRKMLKDLIKFNHIDETRYRVHSLHAGHASEMLDRGVTIDIIKRLGHWKSNAVFKYLKM